MSNKIIAYLRDFWSKHDHKILTVLAIVLTTAVSFQAGKNWQKQQNLASINVNLNQIADSNPRDEKIKTLGEALERKGINLTETETTQASTEDGTGKNADEKNCVFVASKNSTKYHLPTCRYAAKINPGNRVCFSSKEDAESKGYQSAKCCIK